VRISSPPEVVPVIRPISAQATIAVSDIDRARAFYGEALGLPVLEDSPEGVIYRAGDAQILVYPSSFAGTAQSTAAALYVDDVEAAVRELVAAGITPEAYDLPGLKTIDGIAELETERSAWVKDPDGNILAIGQRR
jgi:catechol 2,3-dioxygenase-like lactoylglutathione lyase family enzyme